MTRKILSRDALPTNGSDTCVKAGGCCNGGSFYDADDTLMLTALW